MTDKIRIACATDDGKKLTSEHFGSARIYMMYEMDTRTGTVAFIEKVENTSEEERGHGDPKKARSVSEIMKDSHVILAFAMGTNILRMRKNFCPVISKEVNIEKALDVLMEKRDLLTVEVKKEKGVDREIIRI
jgi:predicted Fe-Mo cluster-binding NifX family protein